MKVTKSRNPDSFVLASARIEITHADPLIDEDKKKWSLKDLMDLGLARGIKVGYSSSKIEVKADNGIVPFKGTADEKATVEASILERHLPTLAKVMKGIVSFNITPKDAEVITDTKAANTLTAGTAYEFSSVNFDGSKPESIAIKQGTKTLQETTDYTISQNSLGDWCFELLSSGAFDATKKTVISYSVKGIKSWTLGHGGGGIAQPLGVRLTNQRKSQDGRVIKRIFEFPYAFYAADDSIAFKSMNDTDNIAEVPIKFECSSHPDLSLREEFAGTSLSQEIQEK